MIVHDYNPLTGLFTNRTTGEVCSERTPKGYVRVHVFGRQIYAHRLAFLIMTGRWPVQIDHLNRRRDDNRWDNIQDSDQFGNAQNHSLRSTNTTGYTGIEFRAGTGWRAELTRMGKRRRSEWLKTKEEAVAARVELLNVFKRGEW